MSTEIYRPHHHFLDRVKYDDWGFKLLPQDPRNGENEDGTCMWSLKLVIFLALT